MNIFKRFFKRTPKSPLSRREYQVWELLAIGDTNKVIALKLGISERTVKNHCTSIYRKLNVKNRVGAVRVYLLEKY